MDKTLLDLLNIDDHAKRYGCGLNPKLRMAIEQDTRFRAKAASPSNSLPDTATTLPKNVVRLPLGKTPARRSHG